MVSGSLAATNAATSEPFEAMLGAAQIMQGAITREKLKSGQPDILLRPHIDQFKALDFFQAREILKSAEPLRDEVKRALEKHWG